MGVLISTCSAKITVIISDRSRFLFSGRFKHMQSVTSFIIIVNAPLNALTGSPNICIYSTTVSNQLNTNSFSHTRQLGISRGGSKCSDIGHRKSIAVAGITHEAKGVSH